MSKRTIEQSIKININDDAINWIAQKGYQPQYGARPLQRFITRYVETPLAKLIIAGKVKPNSEVQISLKDDKLVFE